MTSLLRIVWSGPFQVMLLPPELGKLMRPSCGVWANFFMLFGLVHFR